MKGHLLSLLAFLGVSAIIVMLWCAITFKIVPLFIKWVPDGAPKVGDAFGAVNALFSGLALAGVIVTLYLQQEELKMQREELKFTREELAKSAAAQKESSKSQQFTAELSTRVAIMEYYQFLIANIEKYQHGKGTKHGEALTTLIGQAEEIMKMLEKLPEKG